MNKHVSDFLREVCMQVKYKKIHGELAVELQEHIHELMEEYIEQGLDQDEAAQKAVEHMGNPIEIGKGLHKTHRPKTEWSIIVLISILVVSGGFVLYSIASANTMALTLERFYKSYFLYATLGIGVGGLCFFFDYNRLEKYSLHIFVGALLLLYAGPWFPKVNGLPYFIIGSFNIKPVSIVLPFFLIAFAGLLKKWGTGDIKNMVKILGLSITAVFGCMLQPSFATALILGTGFAVMITTAIMDKSFTGNRKSFYLSIYGGGSAGLLLLSIFLIGTSKYRYHRLLAFLNPKADPMGVGYQNTVLEKLLASAKFWGRGDEINLFGHTTDTFVLPGLNSEFVFTYMVSSFGWVVGVLLIGVVVLTVLRMFSATRKIHSTYGKYVSIAVVTVFMLQAMANILMNLGLFPLLGISLPFISYGGANFVSNMALFGLLLGIYRRKDLISNRTYV